ncbi:ArnT family glycosyltransferase [Bowmanella yangjiangensis]|uniref:Glycosyltransferase family 39 protein n=1 Tax=Bowmanella yangjiangensis TaxID=2811230 RepID=A0ABS3D147_9ALTE|nr:glycosyltransferase family 39 protein [Bowmanella yangjiangensis]MBN7821619.1 glycosyltransferase family 39 protein [Bowmanella yangjiangensis]
MFSKLFSGKNAKLILALLAILVIFSGLGLRAPWPADEPRFAQVAIEMVDSGQWFFPMRGGELYPDKPPVFMWSIALFYWLLGSIKLAFLLPSALCGLLTLCLVYDLGKRLWNEQTGILAAALLLMCFQFVLQAKTAQIDAMVCAWITLGCYGLLRHIYCKDGWHWYYLGFAAMGLGVITKGVGFLPLLMLLPFFLARHFRPAADDIQGGWRWWAGPLAMLAVIALWFVPMLILVANSNDAAFEMYRDNILLKQTAKRYADSWHHIKPFWYYLTSVIPLFWLPLSLLLPWLLPKWWRAVKAGDRRIILPLGWVILVLVFFSLSPGKRGVYILPALPMLTLISAPFLHDVLQRRWPTRLINGVVALLGSLLLIIAIAGLLGVEKIQSLVDDYPIQPWWFLLSLGVIGLLGGLFVRDQGKSWLVFILPFWLLYSTWGYALLGPVKTPQQVLSNLQHHEPNPVPLVIIGLKEQFLLFAPYPLGHFGYHTPIRLQEQVAWQWLAEHPDGRVLVARQSGLNCLNFDKGIDLGFAHREDWLLLDNSARQPDCLVENPALPVFYAAKP